MLRRFWGGGDGEAGYTCRGGGQVASLGHSEYSRSQGPVSWGQEVGFHTVLF